MKKTSKVRKAKTGGCLMVGFFGIFAAVGGGAFYFLTWKPLSSLVAARGWVETECVISSSRVSVHSGDDGSTYRVEIEYTYDVEWQNYRGDRYNFSVGSSSGYEGKARVVEAHPPGSETACYYDPDDPSRSVINRSPGTYLLWGLFPLPFLAVGLGGLLFLFTPAGRRKMGSRPKARDDLQRTAGLGDYRGPLELKTEASPALKAAGALFFAAVWSGMVSLVVFGQIVPSFRRGDVDGCLTVFMIPFALVGIFAIFFSFYQLLAAFNPRPCLTVADGHLTPGGVTTLRWHFDGRAGRLRKLTIELEGLEKVRYRRGTRTYTDTHVFFSRELVSAGRSPGGGQTGRSPGGGQSGHLESVHRGNAELAIPERTMPTFDADNNDVEWRLKLRGDIPFWPDVIDDFPITVYPARSASARDATGGRR